MSAKAVADRGRRGRRGGGKSREEPARDRPEPAVAGPAGNPYLATALAWAVPGTGHLLLGRWQRALGFCALVLLMLVLVLRFGFGYEGTLEAAGFEYGGAFILTAGLMNLLLTLDAWDVARGRKE